MRNRILVLIGMLFMAANLGMAQKRAITNEDLEKYRQKRLAAEKDLRENYERLGFPSPEELQKQLDRSSAERSKLSARLEAENLRRAQMDLERQRAETEVNSRVQQYQVENNQGFQNGYFSKSGYSNYGYGGFLSFPNYGSGVYNRGNRGGFYDNFGNNRRGNFNNQPHIEYRNNLPVIVQPPPRRIAAPR
ncbi:MAG: hypothetical protein M3T96_00530 [Acidobacteriota bacterium]|nr:hypothetical protein [Acidobacteriota bacterium]